MTCPHCKERIKNSAEICPKCRQFVTWKKSWKYGFNRPVVFVPLLSLMVAFMGQYNSALDRKAREKAQGETAQVIAEKNAGSADAQLAGVRPLEGGITFSNVGSSEEGKLLTENLLDAKPQVKKLIKKAFELRNGVFIPFKWGGKSQEEGFDSSGFVAYLLSKYGDLDDPGYRMYSSAHLREKYQTVDKSEVKPGDLIFFKHGFIVFYLGSLKAIGIGNDKGIQVINVDFNKVDSIGRWYK